MDFRKKLWDIYLETPINQKIQRFEQKRLQQIHRKLKQYPNCVNEHYKTIDLSQLESNRNKSKLDINIFQFKDMNRTDNQNKNLSSTNIPANTLHRQQSVPGLSTIQLQNKSLSKSTHLNQGSGPFELENSNNSTKSRFKIIKINENV